MVACTCATMGSQLPAGRGGEKGFECLVRNGGLMIFNDKMI